MNISGQEAKMLVNSSEHTTHTEATPMCVTTLTEKHLQFDETSHKTVKVYGVLSVSMATDDGL